MKRNFVSVGVNQLNHAFIFSWCAISLVRFGTWFVNGWGSTLWIPHHWWITSFSFGTSAGFAKARCAFMYLIWFATSRVILKERNDKLFRTKENSSSQLLEYIRLLTFSCYKAKSVIFYYKFHDWCHNPFLCLGIG